MVEHIVVLMFENRSFDHLLGFLDPDPEKYNGVVAGDSRYSNPVDPTDSSSPSVMVSDDATFGLQVDPPHTHGSVMEQLGPIRSGSRAMNGFVAAYRRRVAGDRHGRQIVHWGRISLFLVVVLALAVAPLASEWPRKTVLGGAGILTALEIVVLSLHSRRRALPLRSWLWPFAGPIVLVVLVGGISFALQRLTALDYLQRFLLMWIFFCGVLVVAIRVIRSRVVALPPATPNQDRQVMRCMKPREKLRALAALASSFAVCTRWHCSVPGATWPNRLFAHAGTSDNTVDIEAGLYDNDSIFDRLNEAGQSWHIYRDRDSLAQVAAFSRLTDTTNIRNWYTLDDFETHVRNGWLPAYSFIEPCHDGIRSNSQHPGNNDFDRPPDAEGLDGL